MSIVRRIPLPQSFDPTKPAHKSALERKVREILGEGWSVTHIDVDAGYAFASEGAVLHQISGGGGTEGVIGERRTIRLAAGTKPSDGDKFDGFIRSQHPGMEVVEFDPYAATAVIERLAPDVSRARAAITAAIGCKPWDIKIEATRHDDGSVAHYEFTLPPNYLPSRHRDRLTEVAQDVLGNLGWVLSDDPLNLRAKITTGDPPMFPPVAEYPAKQDTSRWDYIPVGLDLFGGEVNVVFSSTPSVQISGKSQPLDARIPVPVSEKFPTGWATMGTLDVGDAVYAGDGTRTIIDYFSPITSLPVWEVELDDGQVIECSPDHEWLVSLFGDAWRERRSTFRLSQLITQNATPRIRLPLAISDQRPDGDPVHLRSDHFAQIVSIRDTGRVEPQRCLRVTHPEHTYLTSGWVPTSNTGSGKGILISSIITGCLLRNWEIAIVDATKGAVDFEFARPYCRDAGWGCESEAEGLATCKLIYEEGQRRKALVKQHKVSKWTELPESLGLRPILLVLDEVSGAFTAKPTPKGVPKDHPMVAEAIMVNLIRAEMLDIATRIAKELRFVGIYSAQATQKWLASITGNSTELKSNLGAKILLGPNVTNGDRLVGLADADSVPEVPGYIASDTEMSRGTGVYEFDGSPPGVLKGYFATQARFTEILEAAGVPRYDDERRPSVADVARLCPTLPDDDDRPARGGGSRRGGDDEGWSPASAGIPVHARSVSADFAPTENCPACGAPIDRMTGECLCSK
jgi:hypothetical protein